MDNIGLKETNKQNRHEFKRGTTVANQWKTIYGQEYHVVLNMTEVC
jgi:hypothetical protein